MLSYWKCPGICNYTTSNSLIFITAPDSPPSNVTAISLSNSSVRVEWDKVPEAKRNGIITSYTIGLFNGSLHLRNITVYGEDNLTVVIHDLEMFVTYKVKVLASTAAGSGDFSPHVNATTNQTSKLARINDGYSLISFIQE